MKRVEEVKEKGAGPGKTGGATPPKKLKCELNEFYFDCYRGFGPK